MISTGQFFTLSVNDIEVIVGELAPILLGLALDLFPVAFNAIPIHDVLLYVSRVRQRCPTLTVNV